MRGQQAEQAGLHRRPRIPRLPPAACGLHQQLGRRDRRRAGGGLSGERCFGGRRPGDRRCGDGCTGGSFGGTISGTDRSSGDNASESRPSEHGCASDNASKTRRTGNGCTVDGCTVDGCTVDGCTVDGCTVDGCTVDGCTRDRRRRNRGRGYKMACHHSVLSAPASKLCPAVYCESFANASPKMASPANRPLSRPTDTGPPNQHKLPRP
ncbi:Cys-every-fifth RiPP peptide CefA [Sphingobium sufflavum]|uniref:Cys-every-fifth RiPP peptide CefA n=1 Tax=Sphingobium sufflavum TaxID=1129547 RepID=UPI00389B1316